jgi:hypothetical protein
MTYAVGNLMWHCKNTPPSASSELHEEIVNFSLYCPNSSFASTVPRICQFHFELVPQFLRFIKTLVCHTLFACLIRSIEHMEQPFDDVEEIYNRKLREVLNFFVFKVQLYYSSSRLTLLLTLLDTPDHRRPMIHFQADIIPLPSRLKVMDHDPADSLSFFSVSGSSADWNFFRRFLHSSHPLALDGRRYATAASACLKIIFKHYQAPLSSLQHFIRHASTPKPGVYMKRLSHWHNVNHPGWINFLGTYFSCNTHGGIPGICVDLDVHQRIRSSHLQFLLEKSAHSNSLLDFARRRVFRFGHLQQNHPIYMKKVIFSLAKYIHRITGETAEVKVCESIWGHKGWFSAD